MTTSTMAVGPYDIGHVETAYRVVVTNATPINAYRGAIPRVRRCRQACHRPGGYAA